MTKRIEFIDLEKEIEFLRDRYAFYWAALRTADLTKKCSCINEKTGPKYSCKSCLGSGHLYTDKLVKVDRARSTPGIDSISKIGNINTSGVSFIIEQRSRPKNTDWILELDLEEKTGTPRQPFKAIRAFKIQSAHPCRGKKGKISFWYCVAEERNFETK